MRFAYADPPYFGCGKLYAKHHQDAHVWDTVEAHLELAQRLVEEYPDGWALSCNPTDLGIYLPALPKEVRVGAWCKSFASFKPGVNPAYTWEAVIFAGGRKRSRSELTVRDHLVAPIQLKAGLTGAKPPAFNRWVLDLLGFQDSDQMDDLFPGTGGMQTAINEAVLPYE